MITLYAAVCIPMVLGYVPVVVLSGSMEPTYRVGSVIYYKSTPLNELKEKDVITYITSTGENVSHRIVSIEKNLIETKGDANNTADPMKVDYKNVRGKVASISLPYIGHYIKVINDNFKIVVVISTLVLVSEFVLSNTELLGIKKKKEKEIKNEQDKK